ncbi:hypothetical protein Poly51_04770 [Rubripirellula tenax]|uniref:Uncharacterized protein n=1 Tax=Rubripirellula tenax TaxID=2528015 RepID=A0A5C6FKR0_9BACT|nr:hypothetical protein [Rubripirellula tenax]TWU60202.1 hypothetical protein Poly51_04770 [Rubripirellula tenax]
MWPTFDGLRTLKGPEADLVRGAVGTMLDHLIAEYRDDDAPWSYGLDWFDMWEADQRIWLLEQVTRGLLTRRRELPPAAIWEATVDAIFCETIDLIEIEIADPTLTTAKLSWRQSVVEVFERQHGRPPEIDIDSRDLSKWRSVVARISESILATPSYQKAEAFRDADINRLKRFLAERALPEDFLDRIPPIRSVAETQASIDMIQKLVFVD